MFNTEVLNICVFGSINLFPLWFLLGIMLLDFKMHKVALHPVPHFENTKDFSSCWVWFERSRAGYLSPRPAQT